MGTVWTLPDLRIVRRGGFAGTAGSMPVNFRAGAPDTSLHDAIPFPPFPG
jgi:hypothetical protein